MNKSKLQAVKRKQGVTLIELLVVIAIVGILAAIAVPSYTAYMQRGRRADAKVALEQVRAAQEVWRAEKGVYASGASAQTALQNTMGAPPATLSNYYTWAFTATSNIAFTARATPTGSQASDGWLEIDQNGTKKDQAGRVYQVNSDCKWAK